MNTGVGSFSRSVNLAFVVFCLKLSVPLVRSATLSRGLYLKCVMDPSAVGNNLLDTGFHRRQDFVLKCEAAIDLVHVRLTH